MTEKEINQFDIKSIALYCIIGLVLLFSGFLFFSFSDLQKSLVEINDKITVTNDIVNSTIIDVRTINSGLYKVNSDIDLFSTKLNIIETGLLTTNSTLSSTTAKLNTVETGLVDINSKFVIVNTNVNLIKNSIETSISWFKDNSYIHNLNVQEKLNKCINDCNINLNCIGTVNRTELFITYKEDILYTGKNNHLTSIDEFINNKGGDCEDFALFFKAEYNYLISRGNTCNEWYNIDYYNEYYVISNGDLNVNCAQNNITAHCVNSIKSNKTNSLIYIEPQYGEFIEFTDEFIYPTKIITDDDFYLRNFDNGTWYNFSDILNELKN